MKKITTVAALSVSVLGLSAGQSFADYTLNILHINDWHSRIESNNAFESTCSDEDETAGECIGGAARLVTAINQRREALQGQNMLLLNGGDNFQGSLFYTTYKGTAEGEFLNLMKFDAMTVGNHEFDDGEDALVPFLEMVEFPVLSANVSPSAESKVGDMIQPSVVLEVGGEKIGIVGAVTNDTPEIAAPGPHITIENDIENITAEVEKLEAEGVNKIIALTHVGYVRDMEMVAKIPGVDVVVGGHSHTLLHNDHEDAEGPYPTMIDNPEGYKVPVTQAASYSKYLGEFKVVFDDNGVVKEASGEPLYLDNSIEPDPAVLARIEELGAPIEEMKQEVVGQTTEPIDGSRETCRARECAMGNLITDAMIDRTKDQGVTIAIQNGGGIRASIDGGEVTMGEVLTVLPFQNTLATFQLSGADLKASLEQGLSGIEEGEGKFPQVGGMRYSFDASVAPNEGRLKSAEVMEGGAWVPIDDAKMYTIATNNFVRGGGDGYELFETNAQDAYDFGPGLERVVAEYIEANSPITPELEGRITAVSGEAAPAEEAAAPAEEAAPATEAAPADQAAAPAEEPAAEAAAPIEPVVPAPEAAPSDQAAATAEEPATEEPAAEEEAAAPITPVAPAPEAAPAEEAAAPTEEPAAEEEAAAPIEPIAPAPEAAPAAPAGQAAAPAAEEPAAEEPAEMAAAPLEATHTVVHGDTLWELAERFYGDGKLWTRIAEANPDINPDVLHVGATLNIPPAS